MKFFNLSQVSNYPSESSVYLDDAPNTPGPFHQLYCLYSILHSLLPKNDVPNIAYLMQEILVEEALTSFLLSSLPNHLHLMTEDTQYEYVHDPCSQLLSEYVHSQNYKSVQPNHDTLTEYLPSTHDIDISSPIQYAPLSDLPNVNYAYTLPFSKTKEFLETKVAAMKLRGFNH